MLIGLSGKIADALLSTGSSNSSNSIHTHTDQQRILHNKERVDRRLYNMYYFNTIVVVVVDAFSHTPTSSEYYIRVERRLLRTNVLLQYHRHTNIEE